MNKPFSDNPTKDYGEVSKPSPTSLQEDEELEKAVFEIVEAHFKPTDNSLMPLNATKRIMQLIKAQLTNNQKEKE